jgi:hypothetical protein
MNQILNWKFALHRDLARWDKMQMKAEPTLAKKLGIIYLSYQN